MQILLVLFAEVLRYLTLSPPPQHNGGERNLVCGSRTMRKHLNNSAQAWGLNYELHIHFNFYYTNWRNWLKLYIYIKYIYDFMWRIKWIDRLIFPETLFWFLINRQLHVFFELLTIPPKRHFSHFSHGFFSESYKHPVFHKKVNRQKMKTNLWIFSFWFWLQDFYF